MIPIHCDLYRLIEAPESCFFIIRSDQFHKYFRYSFTLLVGGDDRAPFERPEVEIGDARQS